MFIDLLISAQKLGCKIKTPHFCYRTFPKSNSTFSITLKKEHHLTKQKNKK